MYEQLKAQEEVWLNRLRSELANLPDNHNLNGFPLGVCSIWQVLRVVWFRVIV
jgi:hypothetical protein